MEGHPDIIHRREQRAREGVATELPQTLGPNEARAKAKVWPKHDGPLSRARQKTHKSVILSYLKETMEVASALRDRPKDAASEAPKAIKQ